MPLHHQPRPEETYRGWTITVHHRAIGGQIFVQGMASNGSEQLVTSLLNRDEDGAAQEARDLVDKCINGGRTVIKSFRFSNFIFEIWRMNR